MYVCATLTAVGGKTDNAAKQTLMYITTNHNFLQYFFKKIYKYKTREKHLYLGILYTLLWEESSAVIVMRFDLFRQKCYYIVINADERTR